LITSIYVLIGLVIVLAIFLALTISAKSFRGSNELPDAAFQVSLVGNVLLEDVEINGERLLVIDALVKVKEGEIAEADFKNSLKGLLNEDKDCLGLTAGGSVNPSRKTTGIPTLRDGNIRSGRPRDIVAGTFDILAGFGDRLGSTDFDLEVGGKVERVFVQHYYGGCS